MDKTYLLGLAGALCVVVVAIAIQRRQAAQNVAFFLGSPKSVNYDVVLILDGATISEGWAFILDDKETAQEEGEVYLDAAMREQHLAGIHGRQASIEQLKGIRKGWRLTREVLAADDQTVVILALELRQQQK